METAIREEGVAPKKIIALESIIGYPKDIQWQTMAGLIKKLTKYGNCLALVIDRPVLNLLGIDVDTPLEITTPDGKKLEITPLKPEPHRGRRGREK